MNILLIILLVVAVAYFHRRWKSQIPVLAEKERVQVNFELSQKLDKFLEKASYSEPIGTLNEKPVYRFIKRGEIMYEFKDFLPRNNLATLFNDEALTFNHMHYVRVPV